MLVLVQVGYCVNIALVTNLCISPCTLLLAAFILITFAAVTIYITSLSIVIVIGTPEYLAYSDAHTSSANVYNSETE